MVAQTLEAAARAVWPPPLGARYITPPLRVVTQVYRAFGFVEDQRAGLQQGRVGARVLRRVERALRERDIPRSRR